MLKSTEALVAALKYDGVGMAEYKWNLKTVEIVCYGNICRSPFAAVLEQQLLSHGGSLRVGSSGFHTAESRHSPEAAVTGAKEFGIDLSVNRSQRITAAAVNSLPYRIGCIATCRRDASATPPQRHRLPNTDSGSNPMATRGYNASWTHRLSAYKNRPQVKGTFPDDDSRGLSPSACDIG
jgi:protein-tyrosine-phosphatase